MLVEKTQRKIHVCKMTTGEEVIAMLTSEEQSTGRFVLDRPCVIPPNAKFVDGDIFGRFMVGGGKEITIHRTAMIVGFHPASEAAAGVYLRSIG